MLLPFCLKSKAKALLFFCLTVLPAHTKWLRFDYFSYKSYVLRSKWKKL